MLLFNQKVGVGSIFFNINSVVVGRLDPQT